MMVASNDEQPYLRLNEEASYISEAPNIEGQDEEEDGKKISR